MYMMIVMFQAATLLQGQHCSSQARAGWGRSDGVEMFVKTEASEEKGNSNSTMLREIYGKSMGKW